MRIALSSECSHYFAVCRHSWLTASIPSAATLPGGAALHGRFDAVVGLS